MPKTSHFLLIISLTRSRVQNSKYLTAIALCILLLLGSFSGYCQIDSAKRKLAHYGLDIVQEPPKASFFKNEIIAGYGRASLNRTLDGQTVGAPAVTVVDYYSGTFSLAYRMAIAKRNYLGLVLAYEYENGVWQNSEAIGTDHFNTYPIGRFTRNVLTVGWEYKHEYAPVGFVTAYSLAGLAFSFRKESDRYDSAYYLSHNAGSSGSLGAIEQANDRKHLNFQVTPIGITVGRTYCFFLELGFGYRGILCSGFYYKFGKNNSSNSGK